MISAFFGSLKQEFAGYNSKKLLADMMAGLTVCAVALPLALAFGVSSGASAASGLVTAIIAGVVIAVLGGASFQISGPTGAMSAVLVGIVATYGLQGVFFACFAAGVLLLLSGIFKLGRLSHAGHHGLYFRYCHYHRHGADRQFLRHGVGGRLEP